MDSDFNSHLIPVEIFSEIFLYTVQADPRSRAKLMAVCRHWHQIMLSTPGIHSQLRIENRTQKKDVERVGRRWHLDVTVNIWDPGNRWYFNNGRFFASFMAVARAASRWRSLELVALPPPGEYKDLQIVLPLQCLEIFKLAPSCNLGNFLEPLMTTITTTVTPRLTVMEVLNPDAVPYLVQPAHLHIFSSLTTLRLICRRMQNPVNILPYFHKLETLEAHHLSLPIYSTDVHLPMIQTLRILRLKSVSVQWMADRILPALEECSIIFPYHADAIQSVYMPSCSILKYDSNNLGALEHFHLSQLARLEVKCGQWRIWSGNIQLAALHPIFASQSLTCLHMQIKCSETLLVHMLRFVPTLEELWMGLSSPHALSSTFLLAFAAGGCNATAKIGTSSQVIPPLCRELKTLHLHYKRWLRGSERKALIPAFGEIVASHQRLKQTGFSLCLSFGQGSSRQVWNVYGLVEKHKFSFGQRGIYIGISSPKGIVPLSTSSAGRVDYFPHFTELEYISTTQALNFPIDHFCSLRSLKEVRAPNSNLDIQPNTAPSTSFSFFHALKVLDIDLITSSFLAGQTFQMLERFKERSILFLNYPGEGRLTGMPVCSRLAVSLGRLVTLELPQIRELSVGIYGNEPHIIWEKYIVVNSNLSGLKLLHVHQQYYQALPPATPDLIKILGSLPALETLIIDERCIDKPYLDFFTVFVPICAQETGPNRSGSEGEILGLLCPRLESLQIQGIDLDQQPELMPALQDIVTLHATIGSPLKSFTFYISKHLLRPHPAQKWELIGKDRSFVMEDVPPRQFQLKI